MRKKRKIIVVMGPTAGGKSKIAFELARRFDGFLISADSRQIYKYMDIGTNKDVGKLRGGDYFVYTKDREGQEARKVDKGIKEYMIDVVRPDEAFSVGQWVDAVKSVLKKENKQAIIVGGTGLYISALTEGYLLPGKFNAQLRSRLEKQAERYGLPYLIIKMKRFDPDIEKKIDVNNPRRVIRAAEIVWQTKTPLDKGKGESPYEFLKIGMDMPREKLYKKINARVDAMVEEGLIDEVKGLLAHGYKKDTSAMSGIGYRQVVQYLEGKISLAEAIDLVKRDTRRYAKRQMTWFRRNKTIRWVTGYTEAKRLAERFIKK